MTNTEGSRGIYDAHVAGPVITFGELVTNSDVSVRRVQFGFLF